MRGQPAGWVGPRLIVAAGDGPSRIPSGGFDPDVVAGKQKPQILGVRGEHDHEHRQGKSGGGHYRIDRQVAMLAAGCRSGRPQPA